MLKAVLNEAWKLAPFRVAVVHVFSQKLWNKRKIFILLIKGSFFIKEHIGHPYIHIFCTHLICFDSHILGIEICIRGYNNI